MCNFFNDQSPSGSRAEWSRRANQQNIIPHKEVEAMTLTTGIHYHLIIGNHIHRRHLLLLSPKADTHFTIPHRVEDWVDVDGWLHAERYGAVVPESTCFGIQPYWSSPSTVVFHTAAARPVIPSVNSRPSFFSGRSLYLLEHFARWHSVCTISFCLP